VRLWKALVSVIVPEKFCGPLEVMNTVPELAVKVPALE
jgi:hypothetical protein